MATYRNLLEEAPREVCPENLFELWDRAGNLYLAVAVISKRAAKIEEELNEELAMQLQLDLYAASAEDPVLKEQRQATALRYEQMPKPVSLALEEFKRGLLHYEYRGRLAWDRGANTGIEKVE